MSQDRQNICIPAPHIGGTTCLGSFFCGFVFGVCVCARVCVCVAVMAGSQVSGEMMDLLL